MQLQGRFRMWFDSQPDSTEITVYLFNKRGYCLCHEAGMLYFYMLLVTC